MTRKVPVFPTLLVAAAVAAMLALGVWQLRRAEWKADLLARYGQAQAMSAEVPWPRSRAEAERNLFRWSGFACERVLEIRTTAADNAEGRGGVAQIARCALAEGGEGEVALGWSLPARPFAWTGGEVRGVVGPGGTFGAVLHAGTPAPGLEPLAPPDPADVPNNHLAYAGQWFFFALTALVIYLLALRRRWRGAALP